LNEEPPTKIDDDRLAPALLPRILRTGLRSPLIGGPCFAHEEERPIHEHGKSMGRFNSAATSNGSSDKALRARRYAATPAEIAEMLHAIIPRMKRWRYVGFDRRSGTVHLEHDTPIITFTDDILLHLRADGVVTEVSGESHSRVGDFDFGVNARNLRSILRALDRAMRRIEGS
jgi:uncharacterized protein (DUF1499 family)